MQKEIRIGLFAVIILSLLFWGYKYLLGQNLLKKSKNYIIYYNDVDGLDVSNTVSFKGLKVGTVQGIQPDENYQRMMVEILVENADFFPPTNVVAELTGSVMGAKAIELVCDGPCSSETLVPGSEIRGKFLGLIGSMVRPDEIEEYMKTVQKGIGGVIDSIGSRLGEDSESEFAATMQDFRESAEYLKNITYYLNTILASSSDQLTQSFQNLNDITGNLAQNNERIDQILQNLQDVSHKLNQSPLDTAVTNANRALVTVDETLIEIKQTVATVEQVFQQAKSSEGTMGALLQDRELYETLVETNRQLQLMLQDFRLNPKRYVNVSVFGKRSRDYTVPEDDPASENERMDSLKIEDPD